ncbi:MAG TPA: pentapeptide repeat-containing protein [Ilumatobacteraceae bacterium]
MARPGRGGGIRRGRAGAMAPPLLTRRPRTEESAAAPAAVPLGWSRDPPWFVQILVAALLFAGLLGLLLLWGINRIENRRANQAERLENLRYVRTAAAQRGADRELRFSGLDLRGMHLAGLDLSGADLSEADLTGANLTGADLTGADLTSAALISAALTDANMTSATLIFANLADADLGAADLTDATLIEADLTAANLAFADLEGADLSFAVLLDADLSSALISEAVFADADVAGADLSGVRYGCNPTDLPPIWPPGTTELPASERCTPLVTSEQSDAPP